MSGHDHSGHGHGCGGECHDHDHSNDITPAVQSLLYSQIDHDAIETLNGKLRSRYQLDQLLFSALLTVVTRVSSQGRSRNCQEDLVRATERQARA